MSQDSFQVTDVQRARAKQLENREWLDSQLNEVQKQYPGKVVIVHDKKIVGATKTPDEALAFIGDKYPLDEVVAIMVPIDSVFIVPYPD